MANITWKMEDGSEITAEVKDGLNLMEAATANNVAHIEGECGGCLSCATCHVFVEPEWFTKTGEIDDIRTAFVGAHIVIAPLQTARGVQTKLLEALAMGRAIVASPASLAGLDLAVGREVLEANHPGEWCEVLVGLIRDAQRRRALGRAARAAAEQRFMWRDQLAGLTSLCQQLSEQTGPDLAAKGEPVRRVQRRAAPPN